ncbi:MAG: cytochrome b N-terminal domain-containing protein [Pirellulales bacterium]
MKTLINWLDDRTGCRQLAHEALYERVPGGARWRYVWGSTLVFVFVAQVITGIFLWANYSPSAQTAWESVYFIQYEMPGGWLLRGLHHFFSQTMVVLMALHLMQVVIDGAYRAPREVNFWLGLILMLIVLGLSLTGYLLPWDQKGYWATRVATNLLSVVPGAGPQMQQLVVGGPDYGHHTLTRFFALHAGVLPGLLVLFLVLHIALFRRHGLTAKQPCKRPDCTFWPDQVLKDAVASLAVLIVVLVLVVHPVRTFFGESSGPLELSHLGAELGAPADPANQYSAARPEWYFLFLFQFLKLFEGYGASGELMGAIVVPTLVLGAMFLMPFVGRWKLGHRFNIVFTLILLGGAAALTVAALDEDYRAVWTDGASFAETEKTMAQLGNDPQKIAAHFENNPEKIRGYENQVAAYESYRKSQEYLAAVAAADREAKRAVTLAQAPQGIPFSGAVTLLRQDAKTQGPRLFARYCASCHAYRAPDAEVAAGAEPPSAPNLYGFASRAWIAGLLDPKHVAGPNYFGNTVHKEGEMVSFVNDTLPEWKPEDVQHAVFALSAEAQLAGQAAADQKDAAAIEAGRKVIENEEHCVSCHKFREQGEPGSAPDLTGYGSREWLLGMISNPKHERFYGEKNDRMPAFAEQPDDSPQNMLSADQLNLLIDWLRGEWYEPAAEGEAVARSDVPPAAERAPSAPEAATATADNAPAEPPPASPEKEAPAPAEATPAEPATVPPAEPAAPEKEPPAEPAAAPPAAQAESSATPPETTPAEPAAPDAGAKPPE